jgi:hypothetical protein
MATDDKDKELWVRFALAAQSRYVPPDEFDSADELVDDMIEVATQYADGMMDALAERYDGSVKHRRRSARPPKARRDPSEVED